MRADLLQALLTFAGLAMLIRGDDAHLALVPLTGSVVIWALKPAARRREGSE